ncbi:hypothetical protein M977_04650 [Buttiauxella gaviniae ATCC 51604]|uniref:Uncharacterized protein n=2 Tax=Buttiauxella gaviniae TaxID=82990 RepID=A0A1B7HKR0_9ENTR|nr:hypothetical protein M977_04650 [Buttiauxella gaviniae ATCC 51604]
MPNMEVCEQTLKKVMNGIPDDNYGIVKAPSAGKCIAIINEGKRGSGTAG